MPKVSVPQKDGEIVVSRNGDEARSYKVTDHTVSVAADDLDHFLGVVEGSKPEGGTPASNKEK